MGRLVFKFDAEVYSQDKQCGRLAKIAMNPASWQITDLIIENDLLFERAKVIPVTRLEGMLAQEIYLALNSRQLGDYADHEEIVVEKHLPEQRPLITHNAWVPTPLHTLTTVAEKIRVWEVIRTGVTDDLILLDSNTLVNGLEGHIGRLSHILTTENFLVSHLVIDYAQGPLLPKQTVIPVHLVEEISEPHIRILATHSEVNEFSRSRLN